MNTTQKDRFTIKKGDRVKFGPESGIRLAQQGAEIVTSVRHQHDGTVVKTRVSGVETAEYFLEQGATLPVLDMPGTIPYMVRVTGGGQSSLREFVCLREVVAYVRTALRDVRTSVIYVSGPRPGGDVMQWNPHLRAVRMRSYTRIGVTRQWTVERAGHSGRRELTV